MLIVLATEPAHGFALQGYTVRNKGTKTAPTRSRQRSHQEGPVRGLRHIWRPIMSSTVLVRANHHAEPSVVLFGRDDGGKPRASWFDAASAGLAIKAGEAMRMRILKVETEEQKAVARQLSPGRVFASGRAFTPFARATVFSKLVELAKASNGDASADTAANAANSAAAVPGGSGAASGSGVPGAPQRPQDWDEIAIGSVVLATVGVEDGWWESIVIGVNGEALTLKWRDFPREPVFVRRRTKLALLPAAAN